MTLAPVQRSSRAEVRHGGVEGEPLPVNPAAAHLPPSLPTVRGDVGNTERHNSGP